MYKPNMFAIPSSPSQVTCSYSFSSFSSKTSHSLWQMMTYLKHPVCYYRKQLELFLAVLFLKCSRFNSCMPNTWTINYQHEVKESPVVILFSTFSGSSGIGSPAVGWGVSSVASLAVAWAIAGTCTGSIPFPLLHPWAILLHSWTLQ